MSITTLLIAVALSMDAFSLSIIYGTIGLNKKNRILLSVTVGIYHFIMPLVGSQLGNVILKYIPINPNILISIIFLAISIEMFISTREEKEVISLNSIISLLIFGFSVSLDSFSIGIMLYEITNCIIIPPIIFSFVSATFTIIGLLIGKSLRDNLGNKAIILGSIILFLLGIYYLII